MVNPTGIKPVEFKVLIKVKDVGVTTETGRLLLPDSVRDKQQMANDRGLLVAVSDMAFSDWKGIIPQVGDNVIFNKYAGSVIHYQKDKTCREQFRLCNDKDICAIIKETD